MRVLLFGDYCNPDMNSEPLVGWNTCRSIAEQVDEAVLVTQIRNRRAIERAAAHPFSEVVYLDTEYAVRPLIKFVKALRPVISVEMVMQLGSQFFFERELWRCFGAEITAGDFDIVHRVTPISSAIPCPLASWSPAPVVLGPVNGGLPYPSQFQDIQRRHRDYLRYVRGVWRLLPWADATYRKSAAILAAFDHSISRLPAHSRDRIVDAPEVGVDPARFARAMSRDWSGQMTFLYAGRLVPFKCVDVLIDAFAGSKLLRHHRLEIVGDGPTRGELERQVADAGLGDQVIFAGRLPQAQVAERMEAAHVFAFPSIRDAGAGVVVEAMMSGLPVVAMDYGATSHLLSESSGLRVRLGDRHRHVPDVQAALERLASDPNLCHNLSSSARRRAAELFSWDAKARKIVQVYEWVLGERTAPPDMYASLEGCGRIPSN